MYVRKNSAHLEHGAITPDLSHQINRNTVCPHEDMREWVIQQAATDNDEYKQGNSEEEPYLASCFRSNGRNHCLTVLTC
jgi:hypothetical protein